MQRGNFAVSIVRRALSDGTCSCSRYPYPIPLPSRQASCSAPGRGCGQEVGACCRGGGGGGGGGAHGQKPGRIRGMGERCPPLPPEQLPADLSDSGGQLSSMDPVTYAHVL